MGEYLQQDNSSSQYGCTAFILINVDLGKEVNVLEKLREIKSVKEAYVTLGVYDIVTKIQGNSMGEIRDTIFPKIRKLENIRSTLSLIGTDQTSYMNNQDR